MKKILVTGAAGFIGYHLVNRLCKEGYIVVGIDNLSDYYDVSLKIDRLKLLDKYTDKGIFSFIRMDIADKAAIEKVYNDNEFHSVIHLAAQAGVRYSIENPHSYIESNIVGFINIIEGCRHHKIKNLIYASSSSVYGGNKVLPFSEDQKVDLPYSLYGATKKSNELIAHAYSHLYEILTIGLRFFTVYGPWGRPDMAPYKFTRNIFIDEPINVYNYGKHARSFTYIDDIIEGIYRVFLKLDNGFNVSKSYYHIYNIGGDKPIGLMAYINQIEIAIGKKAKINFLPLQPGDVIRTEADTRLLESEIGFIPKTEISIGIKKFVAWFSDYYRIR